MYFNILRARNGLMSQSSFEVADCDLQIFLVPQTI